MKFLAEPRSGSIAGTTYSRNRFGQYTRNRSIPVNPNSTKQGIQRERFGARSEAWRTLTSTQMAGWDALGALISRTDSLGQSYTLTGPQAQLLVNENLLDASEAVVTDAPAYVVPAGLLTATITLTAASFSVAYTATPLAASTRLFIYCSPQRSAGKRFEADYRLVLVTAAAAASPADIFAAYQARFGTPVVGNKVFLALSTHKGGFLSAALKVSAVVSA